MAESRYNREPFASVLDFNSGHPVVTRADRAMIALSYRGEPPLWGRPRPTIVVLVFLLGFALLPLSALMCFGVLAWWTVYIDIGLIFSSVIIWIAFLPVIRYRELHRRRKVDMAGFITEAGLEGVPLPVVAELRLALGRSFAVDPDLIVPWDTRTVAYQYDNLNRLLSETITGDSQGGNGTISYSYDLVGNRLSRTSNVVGVSTVTDTYNANDELTSEISGGVTTTYQYDSNGNTIESVTGNQSR